MKRLTAKSEDTRTKAKAKTGAKAKTDTKATAKATAAPRATIAGAAPKHGRHGRGTRPLPPAKRVRESAVARQVRATRVLAALKSAYPDADCALRHGSAYELLVATILSAQCTDQRVNIVTPNLFRRYPDARALALADQEELEAAIRSTGFFHNKSKSLLGMARIVANECGNRVPETMDALLRLPGVARKTANCVLGTWFGHNEGIVVDTHVGRIAERLGLAPSARDSKDAERIERDLIAVMPREAWTWLAHALIQHGRTICVARKPKCSECPLAVDCPSAGMGG